MQWGVLNGIAISVLTGVLAFFAPDAWLASVSNSRLHRVVRDLPDMLDMLTISVEAGLGFDAALAKLVRNSQGPLAEEFGRSLQEVQAGASRREALKHMAERVDVPELSAFTASIIQAEMFGVNRLTLHLVYLLSLTKELRARYEKAGIPDAIFLKSMEDFRCKLLECKACHDVWGNATADWHCGFFTMDRFGLGRMQYNHIAFRQDEYAFGDLKIVKGDRVLAMPIPSMGPMPFNVRIDSYKKAFEFYQERGELRNGLLVVTCRSWLLFPKHREMLPEKSNIVSFLDDFDIVDSGETEKFGDDWRVFEKYAFLPPEQWPRDTVLRKAYAELICSGQKAGYGDGVLLFDGERIVNAKNGNL
jgi:hypothetical protein